MALPGEIWRRVRMLLRGDRFDRDMAEEMRLHLELRAAERQSEAAARRQFGNAALLQEQSRDAWGWRWIETLWQDLRYGARNLSANSGFAVTAILSLALGIGANTAIFNIMNAVMLRPLPIPEPERLVQVTLARDTELTNPIWEAVRDHQQAFSGALAYMAWDFNLADGGETRNAAGLYVSGGFFQTLGVPALRGRVLTPEDDASARQAAVISYRFWRSNYAGADAALGSTLRIGRHMFEVVGIAPAWFTGLDVDRPFDIAVPISAAPVLYADPAMLQKRAMWWLTILGRLKPGETLAQAEQKMIAISPEIVRATVAGNWPADAQKDFLSRVFKLRPAATGFSDTGTRYGSALMTLMATVGIVLLIACANIANLLLARSAARQREISVRMAIGASRYRLVRQLMTESLLLSMLGAGAGFLLALWGSGALVRLLSRSGRPVEVNVSPDWRVIGFTAGAAILTAILFGLVPSLQAARSGVLSALKENSRGSIHGGSRFRIGKALVSAQIALSLILLLGAALFLGTLRNLLTIDTGFHRHNLLLVTTGLRQTSIPPGQRTQIYDEILVGLRAIPGVISASRSLLTPISGFGVNGGLRVAGFEPKTRADSIVMLNRISADYFETMKIPLVVGRGFGPQDDLAAQKVMIIDQASARHFFGDANPVGRAVDMGGPSRSETYEIIGVVKDAKYSRVNEDQRRTAYLPASQDEKPPQDQSFELRFAGSLAGIAPQVRIIFAGVNRGITITLRDMETQVNDSIIQQRVVAMLSAAFGFLALVLAMVGLYGVTSYAVTRRRSEIGIRMALGAQRRSVTWLMLRDGLVLLAVGIAAGIGSALALGRFVSTLLFGVRYNDPAQLAGAAAVLLSAAAIAAWLPARRAARLDPMAALREE